jgi:histone demethylase JARID1
LKKSTVDVDELTCEICGSGNYAEEMLICDACDRGHHIFCLNPPIQKIPSSNWYCASCLAAAGNAYGFPDGNEWNMDGFQAFAEKFKKDHFKLDDTTTIPTEQDIEKEYWRISRSSEHEINVEYGADLSSAAFGSGFPVVEKDPRSPYSKCSWNLNNLSVLSGSLLQYIQEDISGMMTPWLYIGMVFSTFCWHVEDHNLYSINYMHWGETKTWYGVPSSDADLFEKTMKKLMPELFETNPDLLFHITTFASPKDLVDKGVNISFCDQRAGEFVVTFPRVYHGGFNHGVLLASSNN